MFDLMGVPHENTSRILATVKSAYKTSGPKGYWRGIAESLSVPDPTVPGFPPPPAVLAGFWHRQAKQTRLLRY